MILRLSRSCRISEREGERGERKSVCVYMSVCECVCVCVRVCVCVCVCLCA